MNLLEKTPRPLKKKFHPPLLKVFYINFLFLGVLLQFQGLMMHKNIRKENRKH